MNKTVSISLLAISLLWASVAPAVTATTYNSTKDLDSGAIDFTTPVNTQLLYLAQVAVNFSAAPESAETITVEIVNAIGTNFAINVLKATTTAASTTTLTLIANAAFPVAVGSAIRVRVTNASQSTAETNDDPTAYVTVTMDTTERTGLGLSLMVNGQIAANSSSQTGGAGIGYVRLQEEGTNLAQRTVANFVGTALTCADTAGVTVCTLAAYPFVFSTIDAPAGTDPVADSTADTLTWTIAAPFTLTGDSSTDTLAIGIPVQTANTAYAGPTTGAAAAPAFRALVDDDVPDTLTASSYVPLAGGTMTGNLVLDNAKEMRWREGSGGGTNYVTFSAPATLASDRTCVLQDGAAPIPDSCVGNGVDEGAGAELDPSLTDDGAVTVGSGAVDPTVLTFDSDAGTDGTLSWTGATDAWLFNGAVGVGAAVSGAALYVNKSADSGVFITNENTNGGTGAIAALRAKSDTATVNFQAHGSGRVATRFGQTLGNWGELLLVAGSGMMVGTSSAGDPLILGSASVGVLTINATDTTSAMPIILDNQKALRFTEAAAGGTNYLEFTAPAAVTTNRTCVLEDDANFIPDSCVGDGVDNAADPWTYLKVTSDFVMSSTTPADVTGLGFTPAASSIYEIKGQMLMRTAAAGTGVQVGVAHPTAGLTDGVSFIRCTASAATQIIMGGNISGAHRCGAGGQVDATTSWPAEIFATLITTTGVTGTWRVQVASETAAVNVTIKAGSWLAYRLI